jgi:hypothetical protein
MYSRCDGRKESGRVTVVELCLPLTRLKLRIVVLLPSSWRTFYVCTRELRPILTRKGKEYM